MKCARAHEFIVRHLYDEISEGDCGRLERHLASCAPCRKEFDVYQALHRDLVLASRVEDPSPSFLAASRIRLENALEQLPPPDPLHRFATGLRGFFAQLQATPGVAVALAVLGLGIGGAAGHYWNRQHTPAPTVTASQLVTPRGVGPAPAVISVSRIVRHPNTRMVEVHFNRIVPETIEGSINDPEVRKLLLKATADSANPSVQSDSVGLLASRCQAGEDCDSAPVRTALMVALRYDHNPNIRLTALEGLQPYIAQDAHVRDAVLESLLHDPYQPIRDRALQMLTPVQADSSVRMVLQTVSTEDSSPAMRLASLKVLQTAPPTE